MPVGVELSRRRMRQSTQILLGTFLVLVATVVVFLSIETTGTGVMGLLVLASIAMAAGVLLLGASQSGRSA